MTPLLLFGLLLVLTFGAILLLSRPSKPEEDIHRHLAGIETMTMPGEDAMTILKKETFSSIPWLDRFLHNFPQLHNLRLLISQAGSNWSVAGLLIGSFTAAVVVAWVGSFWVPTIALALIAGVAVACLPYGYLYFRRMARFNRISNLLPEAVDLMSRALKAGHTVTSAIEMVAQETPEPLAGEFRIVFEQQTLGLPIRDAMMTLAERVPLDDVRFLVTAILVQKETGGNLAEILDKTSAVMRERMRLRGQLRIFTAQGRITGWILCTLPFVVCFLIYLINPRYEGMLFHDPLGRRLVYVGLGMMALGVYFIRRIINIKV
jgi:tight adherence protein B